MTTTAPDAPEGSEREHITAVLLEEWATIDALLESLPIEDWSTPTDLPGWDVRDNVAHLIGIEATLLGDPSPEVAAELAQRMVFMSGGSISPATQEFLRTTTQPRIDKPFNASALREMVARVATARSSSWARGSNSLPAFSRLLMPISRAPMPFRACTTSLRPWEAPAMAV